MTAAIDPSSSVSTNNWPTTRVRAAPSAVRTASSGARDQVRANTSVATLLATTSSTITRTNDQRRHRELRPRPTSAVKGTQPDARSRRRDAVWSMAPAATARSTSVVAASKVAPGAKHAKHAKPGPMRRLRRSAERQLRRAAATARRSSGNSNVSGMMPTTVRGWPPIVSCRPIDARIAAIAPPPQALSDHDDRLGARFAVCGDQGAAEHSVRRRASSSIAA